MPKIIRELGVVSVGKVAGIVYGCIGLMAGVVVALISVLGGFAGVLRDGGAVEGFAALFLGVGAVFVLPLVYGVLGSLIGMFVAIIYNVAARVVGGIEITLD